MAMSYAVTAIPESSVPRASAPIFQHLLDTYAGEISKVATVWSCFAPEDLAFRIHPRSGTVKDVMKHQLLSERRFFAEFLGFPEPPPAELLPKEETLEAFRRRLCELALARLARIADRTQDWWLERAPFFDVLRERIWIFWRRVLHTAHHRTQLTVYLRMLNKPVPPTYGPTADVSWTGADPTTSLGAAGRT
ncbi:MAG TPA: DinB family protein [Planctomycetota bacterium]|jgi:uncharacterized damage-inducible protein DinB|nr:DinB family protein [Planctomycetota bacterium]